MADLDCSVIKFSLPKNFLVVGSTQSGKTELIKRLIFEAEHMLDPIPSRIIYCYSVWQYAYDEIERKLGNKIQFRTDIPSREELEEIWNNFKDDTLLILDDKMSSINDGATGRSILDIACVLSHHCHVSCIITVQNLFHASKSMRELAINTHCMCLFKNYRNVSQIRTLSSQVMPTQRDFFLESYNKSTNMQNYGYLIVDLSPGVDRKFQLRTKIFPDEVTIIYSPKE